MLGDLPCIAESSISRGRSGSDWRGDKAICAWSYEFRNKGEFEDFLIFVGRLMRARISASRSLMDSWWQWYQGPEDDGAVDK